MDSWRASDTDAPQIDARFGAPPFGSLRAGSGRALPISAIRVVRGKDYVGAREATIFSKRGSPRRGSQNGSSFRWP
jgi:hypothetical protein